MSLTSAQLDEADLLMQAINEAILSLKKPDKETLDARPLNHALALVWGAYCGQVDDAGRVRLLDQFCSVALCRLGDVPPRKLEPN